MANNPYSLVGHVNHKTYNETGNITPNFEFSEGIRPAGEFMPAPYLAAVRFNVRFEEYFVLSGGKIVAMDSDGYIVPAGLRRQAAAYKADFDANGVASADALTELTKYNLNDVDRGISNSAAVVVADGEPVVKSFFDTTGAVALPLKTISNPVGVSSYNYWAHPGGNGENPVDFNQYNFSLQNKVAFVCDYQLELPAVEDKATYDAAPFAGMGAMVAPAGAIKPGMFVTYDTESNFALSADEAGYGYGAATLPSEIVGQVLSTDNRQIRDLLDRVRTRHSELGELEKMPGTATGGKSDTLTFSGGYGLVRINLQLH